MRDLLRRLVVEEGGWSRVWYGLATAMVIAGGVLIYGNSQSSGRGCALPKYPDASCTGVPSSVSLTAYTGPNPVTADDTVIDGKLITNCPLTVQAANVTIRNSRFTCSAAGGLNVPDDAGNYTRSNSGTEYLVTIEDSEINCQGDANTSPTGIEEAHVHAIRVEIYDCENGLSTNQNVRMEDSYVHDLDSAGADPHEDGWQMTQGHWGGSGYVGRSLNITILHNSILIAVGTSAIIMNPGAQGHDENILIEKNLLAGGITTVYCPGHSGQGGSGINVDLIDNHWSTMFFETVGFIEATDNCWNETLSGNVYHETGLPITLG